MGLFFQSAFEAKLVQEISQDSGPTQGHWSDITRGCVWTQIRQEINKQKAAQSCTISAELTENQ